jgi:rfaE bifunctional protein nucleotidyltransferase chain/domain
MDASSKILDLPETDEWVAAQRVAGQRIGFTCGSFDLLHAGHAQYLAKARALCDCLLVAVNSDASVRRYKSPLRPIQPERDRMYLVASLESVDAVTLLDDDRPLALLLRWKPDLYIKGGDYDPSRLRSADQVREYGGRVEVIASEFATSTSALIERIAAAAAHAAPVNLAAEACRGLVLLDRDGTLIRDVPYLHDPAQVQLLPGVAEGLAKLQAAGLRLAIASNQQGIGLGYYTMQDFIAVNQQIFRQLSPHGIVISRIYFCPHSSADHCDCRKPAAGMIVRAMRDFATTPDRTFFIGDTEADVQAGAAAGCRTVRVGGGRDFAAAADWIVSQVPQC